MAITMVAHEDMHSPLLVMHIIPLAAIAAMGMVLTETASCLVMESPRSGVRAEQHHHQ